MLFTELPVKYLFLFGCYRKKKTKTNTGPSVEKVEFDSADGATFKDFDLDEIILKVNRLNVFVSIGPVRYFIKLCLFVHPIAGNASMTCTHSGCWRTWMGEANPGTGIRHPASH